MVRTRGRQRSERGAAFLDVFELLAEPFSRWLDCPSLARFGAVSRRTLELEKSVPAFRLKWAAAAEALDEVFPLPVPGNIESHNIEELIEYGDPRIEHSASIFEQTEDVPGGFAFVSDEAFARAEKNWSEVPAKTRVSLMVRWQRRVATLVRALPSNKSSNSYLASRRLEHRLEGHYSFEGFPQDDGGYYHHSVVPERRGSDAFYLLLSLAFLKACELSRCDECCASHAEDVVLNGWAGADYASSSRRDFFWDLVESYPSDDGTPLVSPMVSPARLKLFADADPGVAKELDKLKPLIGARATNDLAICRGIDDLPAHWPRGAG